MTMVESSRFKYRFIRTDEAARLAELFCKLQRHQRMTGVPKLPDQEHVEEFLFHKDDHGQIVAHNMGTFTAVAVDTAQPETIEKSNIVGYLVYSVKFLLQHGRLFYVNSFFIEEPYRRHGLGKKLIAFMQHHARLLKCDKFDVPFMKDNLIGQKFYKSFGAYLVDDEYILSRLPVDLNKALEITTPTRDKV